MSAHDSFALNTRLQQFLQHYPAPSYLIAYSGGLDSHVLLHSCAVLKSAQPDLALRAIHIDHGLQAESAAWALHCQQVCAALEIPLHTVELKLQPEAGNSLEALAREARYQAIAEYLLEGEILLTAHHQDDQAETLLLNLLRGAGTAGLAAMPESRAFQHTQLCRPLLSFSRQELVAYATHHQLQWLEDPSNQDTGFDRNYLRQEILPRLQARWLGASQTLARAAQWQAENHQLLGTLLQDKLEGVTGSQPDTLAVSRLLALEADFGTAMAKALLRQWLRQLGFCMPSAVKLRHILQDVLRAKADGTPCVSWPGCEIRRYRDDVYALPPLPTHDPTQVYSWSDLTQPLWLPELGVRLETDLIAGLLPLLKADGQQNQVTVGFRQGGEKLLMPSGQHISLKKFLQQQGVPLWQRSRLPLVRVGKRIVVIPGYFALATW